MRADGFVGQLIRALARQTPAFQPRPGKVGSFGHEIVTALGRSGSAFLPQREPDAAVESTDVWTLSVTVGAAGPVFQASMNVPPTPADSVDELAVQINQLRYLAGRVMDTPVTGSRGQQLTVSEAQQRAKQLDDEIDTQEAQGSQRHRRVSPVAKTLALTVVVIVDFPIMLWLASSVFNVNWGDPLGPPLAISVVISILTTGGAAAALYHVGYNQRQNKNYRRQLDKAALTLGAKISLVAVAVLILLTSMVAFYRVWEEGVLSGLSRLALLLALLVAVVMLISAWLVFGVAFRDGSPEQDDLSHYTRLVQHHLNIRRSYEDDAEQLEHQLELISRRPWGSGPPRSSPPPGSSTTPASTPSARSRRSSASADPPFTGRSPKMPRDGH